MKNYTKWYQSLPEDSTKQNKKSKLKQYIMRHFEAGFQGFLPPSLDTRFPELVRSLFLLLDDF